MQRRHDNGLLVVLHRPPDPVLFAGFGQGKGKPSDPRYLDDAEIGRLLDDSITQAFEKVHASLDLKTRASSEAEVGPEFRSA